MAEEQNEDEKYRKLLAKKIKEAQIEQQRSALLRKYLTPSAYERMMNVRVSNYNLYLQAADVIFAMIQSGRLVSQMTEEQLLSILSRFTARSEPTIEFRHK
ncbi:MAG: DNA-binding protein [Candidatus Micrarchaeaceae archaeon]